MIGRPTVFKGKEHFTRVQGIMTAVGRAAFDRQRKRLQFLYLQLTGQKIDPVSDGDLIEYLSRGEKATVAYIKENMR